MVRFGAKKVESFHLFYFTIFLNEPQSTSAIKKEKSTKKLCDSKNDAIFDLP